LLALKITTPAAFISTASPATGEGKVILSLTLANVVNKRFQVKTPKVQGLTEILRNPDPIIRHYLCTFHCPRAPSSAKS
jgi:hypothetical protein